MSSSSFSSSSSASASATGSVRSSGGGTCSCGKAISDVRSSASDAGGSSTGAAVHQVARKLLDQALERSQLGANLLALRARLNLEIGAQGLEPLVKVLKISGEALDALGAGAGSGGAAHIVRHGQVETLDPVRQQIEPGNVVLDLIDALQIAVQHDERFLELIQAAADGRRTGRARDHVVGGGHHHVERDSRDRTRHHVDARIEDKACREGRGGDRHGDEDDHIEQKQTPRGGVRVRGHGLSHSASAGSRWRAPSPPCGGKHRRAIAIA